ncbi:hypothetical protein BASA81_000804 [Batrachochytrium salamandrivorans]|nr:hypothetical protein BASA81_000804 [Batrachochytrium salamandrivorans]
MPSWMSKGEGAAAPTYATPTSTAPVQKDWQVQQQPHHPRKQQDREEKPVDRTQDLPFASVVFDLLPEPVGDEKKKEERAERKRERAERRQERAERKLARKQRKKAKRAKKPKLEEGEVIGRRRRKDSSSSSSSSSSEN